MKKRIALFILLALVLVLGILALKRINFSRFINLSSPSISKEMQRAAQLEESGQLNQAREIYTQLIARFPQHRKVNLWQKSIEELNLKLIFSGFPTETSIEYEIKPQDTLAKIAKEFNTTVELLMRANNLKDANILPGKKLKVQKVPFSVLVDKSQNILILKQGDEIVKTYTVSTGTNNSTPTGTFKIITRVPNPPWYKEGRVIPPGDPENILGSYWLGLDIRGYGIHGTSEPQKLGQQVTQGCIRMRNSDVEELFILLPLGTEVTIID